MKDEIHSANASGVPASRHRTVAIWPRADMDRSEAAPKSTASLYRDFAGTLVIDQQDSELAPRVQSEGMRVLVTDTIMDTRDRAAALAEAALGEILISGEGKQ